MSVTHTWNADNTTAVLQMDGTPLGRLEFRPPWMAVSHDTSIPLDVEDREDAGMALLKAVIALDELARGTGPDRSAKAPPRYAEQNMAAWLYTHAKVRRQSGLDYDEWGKKQFMAAGAIFKRVVNKYGDNVPDPDFA
jgi:hypothetical protein